MSSPLGKLARLAKVLLAAFPLALLMVCLNPGGGVSQADPLSSCTTTAGVIVVVDFSHWGGNADRVCFAALTTTTTAYDALIGEGFTTVGDAHDGSAFVCRITEPGSGVAEPSASEDPCTTTPPATAYWSFWIANAGQGAWSVSPLGVMSLVPRPGSVEYWNFGSDVGEADRPPLPPERRASHQHHSDHRANHAASGRRLSRRRLRLRHRLGHRCVDAHDAAGQRQITRAPTSTGGHGAKGAPAASTNSSKGSTTIPGSSARGHSPRRHTIRSCQVQPEDRRRRTGVGRHIFALSGSPLPVVIGGLLVAALAAGAVMVVRRRRRLD